ncbi:MAG TPA: DUF2182 domain-containing protein [Acidimicrobiales bacterium]|nr:DUF2182 domain-containing protein [Acidimicrobiales bacterium]
MSAPVTPATPVTPAQRTAHQWTATFALLGLAALAWAGVIAYARDMGNGPGTMGMSLRAFIPMWGGMMAAMMLPAVAPVAMLYSRTIKTDRGARLTLFVAGYLVVWTLAGVPAYYILRVVDHYAADSETALRNIAVVTLLAAGAYQLSPFKARCLRHCRSPLAQLLRYGNMKGRFRDLKVAVHHAGYCLGCCWALMALFVAFGVMNVWAMIVLAAIVFAEKMLRRGELIGRIAGVVFVVVGGLVLLSPSVADTLIPAMDSMDNPMTPMS